MSCAVFEFCSRIFGQRKSDTSVRKKLALFCFEWNMESVYSIEKFASFLVMKYSKLNCTNDEFSKVYEAFTNLEISREIFKCINLLLKHYKEIVAEISLEKFEDMKFLASKQKYVEQLLSRCLKLSEGEPTFFEFLLVCVYIGRLSECIYEKYRCCKVLKLTADCLEAVYIRKYWDYFKENDEFQGLADFCRNLNREEPSNLVNGEDLLTLFPESVDQERNKKVNILRYLNDIDDVIELNEKEKKQIAMVDKPYLKPIRESTQEDFLIRTVVTSETARDVDLETFDRIDEKTNKTGIRCAHCETKCAQYPKDLVNELKNKEKIRVFVR